MGGSGEGTVISAGTDDQSDGQVGRGGSSLPLPPSALAHPIGQRVRRVGSAPARAPATARPASRGGGAGIAARRRFARRRTGEGCGGREGSRFVWVVGGARTAREMAAPSAGPRSALQQKGLMTSDRGRR